MRRLVVFVVLFINIYASAQNSVFDSLNVVKIDNKPLFNDFKSFLLLNSENHHIGESIVNEGLGLSSDFLILNGMRLKGMNNFPVLGLKRLKNYQTHQPLKFGNSLTGIYEIETKENTGTPIIITDVTLPTLGLNTSLFGEGFFESGMKDVDVELFASSPFGNEENAPSFTIAGKYTTTKNFYPSSQEYTYLDEEIYEELIENPYVPGLFNAVNQKVENTYNNDYLQGNNPLNGGGQLYDVYAKFTLPFSSDIKLSLGNYTSYFKNTYLLRQNMLFNYENNPEHIKRNINSFVNFSHEVFNDGESKFNYQTQLNFQTNSYTIQHPEHKDNLFNYGYVGKFNINKEDNWAFEQGLNDYIYTDYIYLEPSSEMIPIDSMYVSNLYTYAGKRPNGVTFTPSQINPLLSNYTEQYYSMFDEYSSQYLDYNALAGGGALLNGNAPRSSYGLWSSPGTNYDLYSKSNTNRLQLLVNGEFEFKEHIIRAGFEYDRKIYRHYQINPVQLWTLMDALTNTQNQFLDLYNPIIDFTDMDNDGIKDTVIRYNYVYNEEKHSNFDIQLRKKLGLAKNGLEYIDINNYDPKTYSLKMFSADELLNNGNSFVSYMGYTSYGDKTDVDDPYNFFDDEERFVDAFRPKSTAIYGEYEYKNKFFKISGGVRIQKYNADQPVLADPYLMYKAYTVEEIDLINGKPISYPDFVDDDYVVYVDSYENPTRILGFRDGDTWYNMQGEIEDVTALGNKDIKPWIKNPRDVDRSPNEDVFKDFEPAFDILPKVHAEVMLDFFRGYIGHQQLAENPDTYFETSYSNNSTLVNAFNPADYFFIKNRAIRNIVISNPALEPFKKKNIYLGADYLIPEPNYNQDLIIGVKGSQHYLHNMLYINHYENAFPTPYYSFDNYEERFDYKNIAAHLKYYYHAEPTISLGLNYTRNVFPNSEDARNKEVYLWNMCRNISNGDLSVDWSSKCKSVVLRNASVKLFLYHRNGLEYQKYLQYSLIRQGSNLRGTELGEIKSHTNVSLRLDKGYYFMNGKFFVNAYVLVSNLFNRVNFESVYPSTGEPDDDGFLSNVESQDFISSQLNSEVFKNQYNAKLKNPYNYGLARQIKFGVQFTIN